jgi:hypothetical protein
LRFVVILSGDKMTAPEDAEFLEWRNSVDPIEQSQGAPPGDGGE